MKNNQRAKAIGQCNGVSLNISMAQLNVLAKENEILS